MSAPPTSPPKYLSMSDLPGEMMKHSFVAPPLTSRSTRYSPTAFGRASRPSIRVPTGNSSFENARGWMRLPWPAAGIRPHTSASHRHRRNGLARDRLVEHRHQLARPVLARMLAQHPLARRPPNAAEL